MGIQSPRDLLSHLPRDYKDWRSPVPLATIAARALRESEPVEEIAVGTVANVRDVRARIAITSADLRDESGVLRAVWYGRRGLGGKIRPGMQLFVHGRVQAKRRRGAVTIEMNVMSHRTLADDAEWTGEIVPVYPATKDVPTRILRTIVGKNLTVLLDEVEELLPPAIVRAHKLIPARTAWHDIHAPASPEQIAAARRRIVYEEFFGIALAAALVRAQRRRDGHAIAVSADAALLERFARAFLSAHRGAAASYRRDLA